MKIKNFRKKLIYALLTTATLSVGVLLSSCSTHKHDFVISNTIEQVSCTHEGLVELKCKTCGATKEETVPVLPHEEEIDEGTTPTCTTDGISQGVHCKNCHAILIPQNDLPATGHSPAVLKAVTPTIDKEGLTEGSICSVCKEILVEQQPIEKLKYKTANFSVNSAYMGKIKGKSEQFVVENTFSEEVKATPNLGYKFIGWQNGFGETVTENSTLQVGYENADTYTAVFEVDELSLPVVQIFTENNRSVVSKETYLNCTVSVSNTETEYTFQDAPAEIKGRGNSTWLMPKKPYKLKFNKKTDLFGHGKAKTWTLIANYVDTSLMRNYLAYTIGNKIEELNGGNGLQYTTATEHIELFVNGEYLGVYLLCEQVEVKENRIEIDDDLALSPDKIGYLLELDSRAPDEGKEGVDWFKIDGMPYAIKSPDTEDENFKTEYVDYIKTKIDGIYQTVSNGNYQEIRQLIDVNSFADAYIVHELFNICDVAFSSFYLFVDNDGILHCGPIWDFDLSCGDCHRTEANNSQNLFALTNPWYKKLLSVPEFKALVANRFATYKPHILEITNSLDEFYSCSDSFSRNFSKWNILGKYLWLGSLKVASIKTWKGQIEYLQEWIGTSVDTLSNYLGIVD